MAKCKATISEIENQYTNESDAANKEWPNFVLTF